MSKKCLLLQRVIGGFIDLWNPAHPYQHTERTEGVAEAVSRIPQEGFCLYLRESKRKALSKEVSWGRKAGRMMVAFIPCYVP